MTGGRGSAAVIFIALCASWPASAMAQSPTARPAAPDAGFEAAGSAFEALSEADRRAAQDALVWTGYYAGATDGVFGPRTREALMAFEAKNGLKPDGIMDARKLAQLQTAGKRARDAVKFAAIGADPSGVAASLPMSIFTRKTAGREGTRYQSQDGATTFDTVALTGPDANLETLYDRLKAETPARRVTYKVLRPGWFVVSGEAAGRRFYSRFAQGPDSETPVLRGFTLAYPAGRAPVMERIAIAVANSFEPFPRAGEPQEARVAAGPAPALPAPAGTAVAAGEGRWLAVLPPACAAPAVAGQPARVLKQDAASGLALLQGASAPPGVAAAELAAPAEGAVLVMGMAAETLSADLARSKIVATVTPGEIRHREKGFAVAAALQPGFAGAAVIDGQGRLVALAGRDPARPLRVAGVAPVLPRSIIPSASLAALLEGGTPAVPAAAGASQSMGAIAALWRERVAPLTCGG